MQVVSFFPGEGPRSTLDLVMLFLVLAICIAGSSAWVWLVGKRKRPPKPFH